MKHTNKLNIQDYVFEYKGIDLGNASVETEFKSNSASKENIYINLLAHDNEEEYELELSLSLSKNELKDFENKYININDKVNYIDFYEPDTNRIPTLDLENDQDTFSNPSHVWVKKETDNEYFFKISIPSYSLFIVFKLKI